MKNTFIYLILGALVFLVEINAQNIQSDSIGLDTVTYSTVIQVDERIIVSDLTDNYAEKEDNNSSDDNDENC